MQIRVLGCSGGIGADLRTTCMRVDDDILIDAGTGLGNLSLDEMAHIRHIFITHSHLDHITGIPLMTDSIFEQLQGEPVVVHGRAETIKALQDHIFNWTIWPDFSKLPTPEKAVMTYHVMQHGEVVEIDGRRVEMIEVNHVVPGAGYRVESAQGKSFAFSGDTTTNDSFWSALNAHQGLDVLVVESAFPDSERVLTEKAGHYCPTLLAADLAKLRHRPEIYLTHLKPGSEQKIMAESERLFGDRPVLRLFGGDIISL